LVQRIVEIKLLNRPNGLFIKLFWGLSFSSTLLPILGAHDCSFPLVEGGRAISQRVVFRFTSGLFRPIYVSGGQILHAYD
jgi:hypothetical protein